MLKQEDEEYLVKQIKELHAELHNVFCAPDWPCDHWCERITLLRKRMGWGPGWYDYPDEKTDA